MGFILKIAAGIYIVSVLAFSSWSRASVEFYPHSTSAASIGSFTSVSQEGVVFEEDGFLYFQPKNQDAIIIHTNSFDFFEGLELPTNVSIKGQSSNNGFGQSLQNTVVQITSVDFLDNN